MSTTVCLSITDTNLIPCVNMPPAVSEFRNSMFRTKFDFTSYTDVRACAYTSGSSTGSFTGSIGFQWSRDQASWSWFTTLTNNPSLMFNTVAAQATAWFPITGTLTGSTSGSDVWVRPVTFGGDGLTTVMFNTLVFEAR